MQPTVEISDDEITAERESVTAMRAGTESEILQRVMSDRVVLENLPEVICVLDRHQTIIYLSRTVPSYDVADMLGTRASNYVVPEHREDFCECFERAWLQRVPQSFDYASMTGRSWRTRFIPNLRDGAVQFMLASTLETTDHVRAVRERDRRLQHAIDLVGMGTWVHHWDSDVVSCDDALCVIYGVRASEAPRRYSELLARVHPEDRARVHAALSVGRETGEYAELEHRILRPSGELRHVRAKGSTLEDPVDGPSMLFAVFDITDRKRLEAQIYQRHKLEAMGELTAGIAHNFNNLLSVILPNVELSLLEAPPALRERLMDIDHAANRAADLVRQLMMFTRHDGVGEKVPLDPVATVRRTLEIARSTFDRGIAIELQVGREVPYVRASATQLEQVLLNICLNARDALQDAAKPHPSIRVTIDRTAASAVRIRVSDNGPGMDEATRARVFEPFFTTKAVGRGSGLGLASAHAIIRDHGGRIACESKLGQGALFEIELPGAHANASVADRAH